MTIYDNVKNLIPEQYKTATNLNKVLQILGTPFDDLVVVFNDLKNILNLQLASGAQLDLIGDIIVEKRKGKSDVDYRKAIEFKIFMNSSRAFVDDVVRALKIITNASIVIYSDNPPASYTIYTNGLTLTNDLKKTIDKLSAAGVSVVIFASNGDAPFIMTEIVATRANLQDNLANNIIDDGGNQIVVDYQSGESSNKLQEIFQGKGMGVVQTFNLTTNTGDTIITDTGAVLGAYDENQSIVDGGKLNFVYQ